MLRLRPIIDKPLSIDRISYLDRCATGFESLENSRETELNGHHQLRARLARVLM